MSKQVNKPLLFWLTIFSAMVVVFGFWQIRYHILSPFGGSKPIGQVSEQDIVGVYKNLDTDKDGLSDYDEMNKYGTSAFLLDSDGDGSSDKEEIEAGSNPLNSKSTPTTKAMVEKGSTLEQEVKPEAVSAEVGSAFLAGQAGGKETGEISAQEIRDLLVKQGGLSQELVNNLLDEDLIKLYNETKKETGIDIKELSKEAVQSGNLSEAEKMIQEMDPKILREMLISQGVDKTMLEQIDDQTLKELFLQSLDQ